MRECKNNEKPPAVRFPREAGPGFAPPGPRRAVGAATPGTGEPPRPCARCPVPAAATRGAAAPPPGFEQKLTQRAPTAGSFLMLFKRGKGFYLSFPEAP